MTEWRFCDFCGARFAAEHYRPNRFCGQTCSNYSRFRKPVPQGDPLQPVADKCANFIINAGTAMGVSPRDLFKYVGSYAALCGDDRFRVCVLVCKARGIAYTADDEDFRFWPKAKAPEGVAVATDPKAP